jgi:hypothetical protein
MKLLKNCLTVFAVLAIGCAAPGPPPSVERLNRFRSKVLAVEAGRHRLSGEAAEAADKEIKGLMKEIVDMEKKLGVPRGARSNRPDQDRR